jgi:hypothetical protein
MKKATISFSTVVAFGMLGCLTAGRVFAESPSVPLPTADVPAATTDEAEAILREVQAETDATATGEPTGDPKFLIYGFLDTGLQRYFHPDADTKGLLSTNESTFVSGNSNVYLDVRPASGWRGLLETRLTLLPSGVYDLRRLGTVPRVNTRYEDATSPSGRNNVQIGGVIIERSQIEWTHNDAANLRMGYFFTPWGIWNVDHGTPTLISLFMPGFLVQEAIPQRQTGVEFYGRLNGPPWQLEYHAYVSNGRTETLFDLSDNKAVGGRLVLHRSGLVRMALGLSGLYGNGADETKLISLGADGYPVVTRKPTYRYEEQAIGADLSLDYGGFRLRTEVVQRVLNYEKGLHFPSTLRPGGVLPSFTGKFAYVIAAYRFARHFEPFIYMEYGDGGLRNYTVDSGTVASVGLNIYFTPYTQLKSQYMETDFSNFSGDHHKLGFFTSRLVLAF